MWLLTPNPNPVTRKSTIYYLLVLFIRIYESYPYVKFEEGLL